MYEKGLSELLSGT
jgi:hypothetical protein